MLTCSSVRGSQYIQGAALVLWNRSSRSFTGGSSGLSEKNKMETMSNRVKMGANEIRKHFTRFSFPHLSFPLSSLCSCLSLCVFGPAIVTFLFCRFGHPSRNPSLYPGPTPAQNESSLFSPSLSLSRPTGLSQLKPLRLAPFLVPSLFRDLRVGVEDVRQGGLRFLRLEGRDLHLHGHWTRDLYGSPTGARRNHKMKSMQSLINNMRMTK